MTTIQEVAQQCGALPVWIRAPSRGVCYWSGLSRSKLYELAGAGKIESVSLREEGQTKATRLFRLQSVFDYIQSRGAK